MTAQEKLVSALSEKGLTASTAESCTGGLIAKKITDVAGCSSVFLGGVVSYANSVKQGLLGVPAQTLETVGAVSPETAEAMARGAAAATGADVGIATTGIAGPGGATPGKPVGLVYIAAYLRGKTAVTENHFSGTRGEVREKASDKALLLALEMIESEK
jgi:PncC family amidohydrolase